MQETNFNQSPDIRLMKHGDSNNTDQTKFGVNKSFQVKSHIYEEIRSDNSTLINLRDLIVTAIANHKCDKAYIEDLDHYLYIYNFPCTDNLLTGDYMLNIGEMNKIYKFLLDKNLDTTFSIVTTAAPSTSFTVSTPAITPVISLKFPFQVSSNKVRYFVKIPNKFQPINSIEISRGTKRKLDDEDESMVLLIKKREYFPVKNLSRQSYQ